ncbi:MAG TPA: tripartite tricarboxylate transporter substrate binding protein, partial [Burkholderiales bacterium]|nr:tripartite tricarboxylate transporter substrate binding protein [Burkholderiales bacterium]
MPKRLVAGICVAAAIVGAVSPGAQAQDFPNRPIRMIVPFPPGGVMDVTARAVATPLQEGLGQSVIIENRPGGGGNIGTEVVARAAPDGYTLLVIGDHTTIAPAIYSHLSYDFLRDFAPITNLVTGSHVLVAHSSLAINNVQELIAEAKKHPGELSYASPGSGTAQHLGAEMLKAMAGGLQITHIPYKGGGQAITDVVGGQVKLGMLGLAPALPHIRSGKLKALGVTGAKRVAILPDVPTIAESGLPGFVTLQWYGLAAPAATPQAVIQRLYAEAVKAVQHPATVERLAAVGMDVAPSASPA